MKRELCLSLGLILAIVLAAPAATAQCSPNKVPVTLINPAGKVLELCMPESAVSGLQQGAEASGTEFYQAACPCWTQEEVAAEQVTGLSIGGTQDGNCQWAQLGSITVKQFMAVSTFDPDGSLCAFPLVVPHGNEIAPNGCYLWRGGATPGFDYRLWELGGHSITAEEMAACIAILKTFECEVVACIADPCFVSTCGGPGDICTADYCGGCFANWYDASGTLTCREECGASGCW